MSLAGRLTAFFLTALALVLAGFSTTLYLLARSYLHRQVDERLEAALGTLSAAAEITPDGVEWEPQRDRFNLGQDSDDAQVRWVVYDGHGHIIDRAQNLGTNGLFEDSLPLTGSDEAAAYQFEREGQSWRLRQRSLRSSSSGSPASSSVHKGEDSEPKYPVLILRAGVSLRPQQAALQTLAVVLPGLSIAVWLLAAVLGRRLVNRALIPVTRMADAARLMTAADLGQRLPAPETKDALDELGSAFNDLLARLQEAFERQRRFTGDASHELRTPLAVMLGQVEVALRHERPPEEYQRVLRIVSDQAVRLQRIVEMLLFLAGADAEAALPSLTTVDLGPWLRDHLHSWSNHPRASDIRLSPSKSDAALTRAHEALLGQVVDILLDNACKYSRPGTPVTISIGGDRDHVELIAEDQGSGIDASDLPRIFDPFYRSPRQNERGVGGVGLGLAIAQRVIDAMGGTIEVHSEPGRGSRFVVRLARGT